MNIFFEMIKEADDNVLCKSAGAYHTPQLWHSLHRLLAVVKVSLEERLDLLSKFQPWREGDAAKLECF